MTWCRWPGNYGLFWHYDLTEEEARQMLSRSTLK